MRSYSPYIDPYLRKIKNNEVLHCQEQELMIDNLVIPVLEREDVIIDNEKIEKGLSLQKYFPYRLIEWEVFLFALIVGVYFTDGDIVFNEIRVMVGLGRMVLFLSCAFTSYRRITGYAVITLT